MPRPLSSTSRAYCYCHVYYNRELLPLSKPTTLSLNCPGTWEHKDRGVSRDLAHSYPGPDGYLRATWNWYHIHFHKRTSNTRLAYFSQSYMANRTYSTRIPSGGCSDLGVVPVYPNRTGQDTHCMVPLYEPPNCPMPNRRLEWKTSDTCFVLAINALSPLRTNFSTCRTKKPEELRMSYAEANP